MTIALTIQAPDADPMEIIDINAEKPNNMATTDPREFITSNLDFYEDLYRAEVFPFSDTTNYADLPIAYELKCEQLVHQYFNDTIPINLPAEETTDRTTPEQLRNLVVAIGTSREMLQMQGVLVDRGIPLATNLTKHTFLNLARKQWSTILHAPANPLAYPRLTLNSGRDIFEPGSRDANGAYEEIENLDGVLNDGIASNELGFPRYIRGMISQLTFTLQGGRPDIWNWRMEFVIIKNENFYSRPAVGIEGTVPNS